MTGERDGVGHWNYAQSQLRRTSDVMVVSADIKTMQEGK